jgi:hypothetical protein
MTARGVKVMLTREGVDYSALTLTDDPRVWTDVETRCQGTAAAPSACGAARQ